MEGDVSHLEIGLILAAFLLAGALKGIVGLGLPTVSLALLSPVIGVHAAMTAILLPTLLTNAWQTLAGPDLGGLLRRLWPLLAGLCVGTLLAGEVLVRASEAAVGAVLGVTLLVYVATSLTRFAPRTPWAGERWLSPLAGLATGALAGTTGTFVVPSVIYMRSLDWSRDLLVQGMGLVFLTGTLILTASLGRIGFLEADLASLSLAGVAPALAGVWLGQRLRRRLSARAFHHWMLLVLATIGAHLLLAAV